MNRDINEVEFTIFDTETTGLEPATGDRIVEIAALKFKGKEKIATFQSLVNPQREISPAAFAVNKITPQMLVGAPLIAQIMPDFLKFIRGTCLCSYNAAFDLNFLNNELRLMQMAPLQDTVVIDILKMAKRLLPALASHALWMVANNLGIKMAQAHRALSDVELSWEVFNRLKAMLIEKGIVDFRNFIGLFGFRCASLEDVNNQKIAEIQKAINLGVKLKIKYLSVSAAEVTEREVAPKEIKQEKNRMYLVGHCSLRNEERSFRIDGILHLEIV